MAKSTRVSQNDRHCGKCGHCGYEMEFNRKDWQTLKKRRGLLLCPGCLKPTTVKLR